MCRRGERHKGAKGKRSWRFKVDLDQTNEINVVQVFRPAKSKCVDV